jgi:hypothetical protein
MAQNKITKDIEKKLSVIASHLPLTTYGVKKHVYKRLNDNVIERTTIGENMHKVNHKNRLKTVFKDSGIEGVRQYINDVKELTESKVDIAVNL